MLKSSSSAGSVSRNLSFVKQYYKKPMTLVVAILYVVLIIGQVMMSSAFSDFYDVLSGSVQQITETLKQTNEDIAASSEAAEEAGDENAKAEAADAAENVEQVEISVDEINELIESSKESTSRSYSISIVLNCIIAVCIFMIFLFSISPSGGPTIFFSILHVLSVIQLIITSLGAILFALVGVLFIFSTKSIMGSSDIMSAENTEALTRNIEALRTTFIILFLIAFAIIALYLYYINAQTAFLKSVTLTCKNPQLKSKGAVPYGNISMVFGVIMLIVVVISYLLSGSGSETSSDESFGDLFVTLPAFQDLFDSLKEKLTDVFSKMNTATMVMNISNALALICIGFVAKGWEKFAKQNADLLFESVGAGARFSDNSPMPTFNSNTRASHDARQQSQPYLIGEETDPNKKSSYIPEELQNDYQEPAMFGQQGGQPGFGGNPYGGAPFGQQGGQPGFGGDPYGQPPADPFAAQPPMGGNPYGDPYNPGGPGGYNSGMM